MAKKSTAVAVPNLDEIVALARRQVMLEELVADSEAALSSQKEMLRGVSQEDLPAAMAEAGLRELTLDSGEKISIKPDFSVSIPAARKDEAYAWLNEHGFGGMIKTVVAVLFGKGELEKAQTLATALVKRKLTVELAQDVHWQTLKAFVAEQTREAKPIPLDLFGAIPMNKAIIKPPKRKDQP